MNCLEYRRGLLSGEGESPAMNAHRLQCVSCADAFRDQEAFEGELRRALEVPVPPRLAADIVDRRAGSRRRFLAAAGVAALTSGLGAYAWLGREDELSLACIDFVMKEEAKSIMMGAMPRAEAETALAPMVPLARLERIGQIRHIAPCPFNGGTAYHIILAVPQGKVTLLVMPTTAAGGRSARDGMHARVVPLRHGSVGIVAGDAGVASSVAGALKT
jgi:hypothetical protein